MAVSLSPPSSLSLSLSLPLSLSLSLSLSLPHLSIHILLFFHLFFILGFDVSVNLFTKLEEALASVTPLIVNIQTYTSKKERDGRKTEDPLFTHPLLLHRHESIDEGHLSAAAISR